MLGCCQTTRRYAITASLLACWCSTFFTASAQPNGGVTLVASSSFRMFLRPTTDMLDAEALAAVEQATVNTLLALDRGQLSLVDIDVLLRMPQFVPPSDQQDGENHHLPTTTVLFTAVGSFINDDEPSSLALDGLIARAFSSPASKVFFRNTIHASGHASLREVQDVSVVPQGDNDSSTNQQPLLSRLDVLLIVVSGSIFCGIVYMIYQHHKDENIDRRTRMMLEQRHSENSNVAALEQTSSSSPLSPVNTLFKLPSTPSTTDSRDHRGNSSSSTPPQGRQTPTTTETSHSLAPSDVLPPLDYLDRSLTSTTTRSSTASPQPERTKMANHAVLLAPPLVSKLNRTKSLSSGGGSSSTTSSSSLWPTRSTGSGPRSFRSLSPRPYYHRQHPWVRDTNDSPPASVRLSSAGTTPTPASSVRCNSSASVASKTNTATATRDVKNHASLSTPLPLFLDGGMTSLVAHRSPGITSIGLLSSGISSIASVGGSSASSTHGNHSKDLFAAASSMVSTSSSSSSYKSPPSVDSTSLTPLSEHFEGNHWFQSSSKSSNNKHQDANSLEDVFHVDVQAASNSADQSRASSSSISMISEWMKTIRVIPASDTQTLEMTQDLSSSSSSSTEEKAEYSSLEDSSERLTLEQMSLERSLATSIVLDDERGEL